MRGVFKEIDFKDEHWFFVNPARKEFLIKNYKNQLSASEFIENWMKIKSTSRKSKNRSKNCNPPNVYNVYQMLDDVYNFWGNYNNTCST